MKLLIFLVILQLIQNGMNLRATDVGFNDGDISLGSARIYGGSEVRDIRNFIFTGVLIENRNNVITFFCGCAKLTRFAAVTTANCINARVNSAHKDKNLMVRGNTLKWKQSGFDDHTVSNIYTHPNFSRNTMDYDVAVLKVKEPFERVTWLKLPTTRGSYKAGVPVTTLGWGSRKMDGLDGLKEELYAVDLKVQDWKTCNKELKGKLTSRMFCAGLKYHGPCTYDKGGPIFSPKFENKTHKPRVLLGLVSFTVDDLCGVSAFTSIYTNLFEMRAWIMRRAMKNYIATDDGDNAYNRNNHY